MNGTENTGDKKQEKREGNADTVGSAMDRGRKPDFSPHLLRVKEQHWKAAETRNKVGMDRVDVRQESKGGPEQCLGCLSPQSLVFCRAASCQGWGAQKATISRKDFTSSPGRSLHSLFRQLWCLKEALASNSQNQSLIKHL